MASYVIGVDVGGTNTDAVCLDGNTIVDYAKVATTADVTSGVKKALQDLLAKLNKEGNYLDNNNRGLSIWRSLCKIGGFILS